MRVDHMTGVLCDTVMDYSARTKWLELNQVQCLHLAQKHDRRAIGACWSTAYLMVNAAAALGAAAAAAAAAHPQAGHQLRCIRQVERLPGQHIGEQGHKVRGSVNGVEGTGDGGCELQGCGAHSRGRVLWLAGQWWVLRGGD